MEEQNKPPASSADRQDTKYKIQLPRPMIHTKDYDFSFSGLKTAVLYDYQKRTEEQRKSEEYVQSMAAEIQQAIIDVLVHKTIKAAKEYGAETLILGGGVAANQELRKQLAEKIHIIAPPSNLSTDNGLMIALAGYVKMIHNNISSLEGPIEAKPNLRLD